MSGVFSESLNSSKYFLRRGKCNEPFLNSRQEKLLSMLANPSLKMFHIRQQHTNLGTTRGTEFVTEAILKFNQTGIQESLEDHSSIESTRQHYGWEGRDLYSLALDLFGKSTRFPSLEVLAYGAFSDPVSEDDHCLLIIKDTLVPAVCTVISASELVARTTVKSPVSFLAAFSRRSRTFWRDTNKMGA